MTQVGDRHLAQRAVVIGQRDPAIEDPWIRGMRGCGDCRETPFSSIRRHAELGVRSSPAPVPWSAGRATK